MTLATKSYSFVCTPLSSIISCFLLLLILVVVAVVVVPFQSLMIFALERKKIGNSCKGVTGADAE